MSIDEIEEMIEEMYSLAEEYSVAYGIAQDLKTKIEGMYDEIESLIDESGCDIELHRLVHVLESNF